MPSFRVTASISSVYVDFAVSSPLVRQTLLFVAGTAATAPHGSWGIHTAHWSTWPTYAIRWIGRTHRLAGHSPSWVKMKGYVKTQKLPGVVWLTGRARQASPEAAIELAPNEVE